jgi:hypothetical protein
VFVSAASRRADCAQMYGLSALVIATDDANNMIIEVSMAKA